MPISQEGLSQANVIPYLKGQEADSHIWDFHLNFKPKEQWWRPRISPVKIKIVINILLRKQVLVCWPYFSYVDHISGMLTIFLVCGPYFRYVDHISDMLTIFMICWPYFWYVHYIPGMWTITLRYVDHISGMLTIFMVCWQ